jgi:DNA-binding MarR family transcriptional regulator
MTEVPDRGDVLHLIGRVCGCKYQRVQRLLDALGLYHGQPPVLNALWEHEGMTQSELAERLNRSPSTITKMVQRMEKAGFVARCDDPEDERVSRVHLTDAGREVRAEVVKVWQTFARAAFADFTEEEVAQFHALLQRVHHNIHNIEES